MLKKIVALVFVVVMSFGFVACKKTPVHVVTFVFANGSENLQVEVKNGKTVSVPQNPTSKYFNFEGWFLDSDCTEKFDNSTKIKSDTKIFAKWTEKSGDWDQIDTLAKNLQKLVIMATEFDKFGKDAQVASAQFVRVKNYNSNEWNLICGSLDEAYEQKVLQTELSLLREKTIVAYGQNSVDFVHMMAALNACLKSGANSAAAQMCGYAGDLAQVVGQIENVETSQQLQKAKEIICAETSVFSVADFWADVLAEELAFGALQQNTSYAELLADTFAKEEKDLVCAFVWHEFGSYEKSQIATQLKSTMRKAYVAQWLKKNTSNSQLAIDFACDAFAEILIERI